MGQDNDQASTVLTLDSVFNIKGPVRLVPQAAPQKPHIVLKRKCLSKDADQSPCLSGTTHFSFVANKRFTISKGHTLSLGIGDPTVEDELKLLGSERSFLLEFDFSNQIHTVDNLSSLPARVRKSMTGARTYDAFAERQGPHAFGFPGYPPSIPETRVFASASVQTDPVDSVEIALSSSTRIQNPKPPIRLYPSPISTDGDPADASLPRGVDSDIDAPTEASFSSMDLGTPSQSSNNSPVVHRPPRPGNESPFIPVDFCFLSPAAPEVRITPMEDSESRSVSTCAKLIKSNELEPRAELNSCSTHTNGPPNSKEISQPKADSPPTGGTPSPANVISTSQSMIPFPASNANAGNPNPVPRMPRPSFRLPEVSTQVTLAPIPQPTISNPLGIRPSNTIAKPLPKGPRMLMSGATPAPAPARLVQPTASTPSVLTPKKPVVVGARWTALRGSSSSSQANNPVAASPGISSIQAVAAPATNMPSMSASPIPPEITTIHTTGKRKSTEENGLLNSQLSLLKKICNGNAGGGSEAETKEQNQTQSHGRRDPDEQPRKRAKIEIVGVDSLPLTSAGLLRDFSPPLSLISRVDSTSADGGDMAVGVLKSKSQRKRERQRMSRQRKAELELVAKQEEAAKIKLEQEEKEQREQQEQREQREKKKRDEARAELEKEISDLTQEKIEAISRETSSSAPLRVVHPLPPKPQIAFTGSSYRPGTPHERRGRSPSWSEGSSSRSRSRSRGREDGQASQIRSASRCRSRSKSKKRTLSMDPQQDNGTKSTGFAGNASGGQTPLPGTTAVVQPQAVIGSENVTCPTTNPRKQFDLFRFGGEGIRTSIQLLTFSNDGGKLAVVCNDMTVRIWQAIPQARELFRLNAYWPVVAICWLQYDAGVLLLFLDGSTDVWAPKMKMPWQRRTLFNVPLSGQSDKPLSLAYGMDKIAVSTSVSVKIWWLTMKDVWQVQQEIKRSRVSALRFQTDGSGLFGGCRDGTLWYCEVPNGTLRAYAFLPSNKCITSIHLHPNGTKLLIGQKGGTAYLISNKQGMKGNIEKTYCAKDDDGPEGAYTAIFATNGQAVVNGSSNGCAFVWDRKKGNMVYGLKHGTDDAILAVAAFDGWQGREGMMASGTRDGKLSLWPIPQASIR